MITISPEEAERRLRTVSQLRDMVLELRAAARIAKAAGGFPSPIAYDIRSDGEYWTRLNEEYEARQAAAGK